MHYQVSVIIPLYNTKALLSRCCESLFEQSLHSLQFVFVDDASTDGSLDVVLQVLERYPMRQSQVLFVRLSEHQGVGAARQRGLECATGDYIIHCDSDDWVEPVLYELLYNKAIETEADIVTCGYSIDREDGTVITTVPAMSQSEKISFSIGPQIGSLCLKLIRNVFILQHHLRIPVDIKWGEDLCFSLQSLLLTHDTQSVDEPLYHYVQHKESLTHTIDSDKCFDLIKCGAVMEDFLVTHQLFETYRYQLNWLKFQLKQYLLIFPETRAITSWRTIYPESNYQVMHYSTPLYLKLVSWLIVHHLSPLAVALLQIRDILSPIRNA